MKRFWNAAAVTGGEGAWGVALDGKPVRTPARAPFEVPTRALAEAIAAEWHAQADTVDPRAMPLTGLANAAIDRVAADPTAFAAMLSKYGESDLLYYRADRPARLVERQAAAWDPLLAWARRRYDVDFVVGAGVLHMPQPEATVTRLAHAVAAFDAFALSGLAPMVTIGGSLIVGLAVIEHAVTADAAWSAVSVDEQFQLEEWGADADAVAALALRKKDFLDAAGFLALIG